MAPLSFKYSAREMCLLSFGGDCTSNSFLIWHAYSCFSFGHNLIGQQSLKTSYKAEHADSKLKPNQNIPILPIAFLILLQQKLGRPLPLCQPSLNCSAEFADWILPGTKKWNLYKLKKAGGGGANEKTTLYHQPLPQGSMWAKELADCGLFSISTKIVLSDLQLQLLAPSIMLINMVIIHSLEGDQVRNC